MVWTLAVSGVKETRQRPPPSTCTWLGTSPSLMLISSCPSPACDASTVGRWWSPRCRVPPWHFYYFPYIKWLSAYPHFFKQPWLWQNRKKTFVPPWCYIFGSSFTWIIIIIDDSSLLPSALVRADNRHKSRRMHAVVSCKIYSKV